MNYVDSLGRKVYENEVYISNDNDSLYNQYKKYNNLGEINIAESIYYDFDLEKDTINNIYSGKIEYHEPTNLLKYKIKEKKITLHFWQQLSDGIEIIKYSSENEDYIEFEFYNETNNIIGLLEYYKVIDTIINDQKKLRVIHAFHPINNKQKSINPFIKAYDLKEILK